MSTADAVTRDVSKPGGSAHTRQSGEFDGAREYDATTCSQGKYILALNFMTINGRTPEDRNDSSKS